MPITTRQQSHKGVGGSRFFAITPNDSTDLAVPTRGIMVTGAGAVAVVGVEDPVGSPVTLPGLNPGTVYPFCVRRVMSTNTVATGIIGIA